jgi:hypothetical protein
LKWGSFIPHVELKGRWVDDPIEFRYRHLMLGTYYRLSRHVKVGAFYQYKRGARHDDDWRQFGSEWNWELYLALNYSSAVVYSKWPCLEILDHLSRNVKLSGSIGYRVVNRSTSRDMRDNEASSYEVKYRAVTLDAGINIHFDLS